MKTTEGIDVTYFTALVISYIIAGEEVQAVIWTKDQQQCEIAMGEALPLYTLLMDGNSGAEMRCIPTDVISKAPPPPPARPRQ